MSDKLWQRELAQVNQDIQEDELRRLDERWDRLSRGELNPEEDAELRALAETSEEAHTAYEAFKPLGPEFQMSIVQKIREQQAIRKQELEPTPKPDPKPLPFRRRTAVWGTFATLAAAASLVLVVRPLPPLPDYAPLEISRDVSTFRGGEMEIPTLTPGDGFTVTVRPETAVRSGSKLETFCVLARDRELRSLEVRSEIVPEGLAILKGSIGRDVPPGRWTLWAVVGRPGELPEPDDPRTFSPGARERDWVAVGQEIMIRPRASNDTGSIGLEDPFEN